MNQDFIYEVKQQALTALHVNSEVRDVDKTQTVVLGYDDMDIEKENMGNGVVDYYLQLVA